MSDSNLPETRPKPHKAHDRSRSSGEAVQIPMGFDDLGVFNMKFDKILTYSNYDSLNQLDETMHQTVEVLASG